MLPLTQGVCFCPGPQWNASQRSLVIACAVALIFALGALASSYLFSASLGWTIGISALGLVISSLLLCRHPTWMLPKKKPPVAPPPTTNAAPPGGPQIPSATQQSQARTQGLDRAAPLTQAVAPTFQAVVAQEPQQQALPAPVPQRGDAMSASSPSANCKEAPAVVAVPPSTPNTSRITAPITPAVTTVGSDLFLMAEFFGMLSPEQDREISRELEQQFPLSS